MKTMKQRKIYMGFIFATGFIMVILQNYVYKNASSSIVGTMGAGFVVISLLRMYQYRQIESDPKRKEQFEIMCDEERVVFVANKARSMMFAIAVIAELVACIVAAIIGSTQISVLFGFLTGVQTLGYLICYGIFNLKY